MLCTRIQIGVQDTMVFVFSSRQQVVSKESLCSDYTVFLRCWVFGGSAASASWDAFWFKPDIQIIVIDMHTLETW